MKDQDIAELCGIILGDGHLNKSSNRIVITGSLEDEPYHKKVVATLFKTNFEAKPIFFRQEQKNAHYLQVESKCCMDYFLGIGLKRGSKENIQTPFFINHNKLRISFLRGLFDTDGWIKFSSQKTKMHYYPRIRLTGKESLLAYQIGDILKVLGFSFSVWNDRRTENTILNYEISGKENALRWFNVIQPHNPKHLKRYSGWLADGQVPSRK